MKSVLGGAVDVGAVSVGQVARLIRRPVGYVQRLISGEVEFCVSEIVVIAFALGRDWRPLLLSAVDGARDQSGDRLPEGGADRRHLT